MDLTPKPPTSCWSFKRIFSCCLPYQERVEAFAEEEEEGEEENDEDDVATHLDFCASSIVAQKSFFLYRPGVAVPPDVTRVRVHRSVTVLPADVFRDQCRLREAILPEGLREIGAGAFRDCTSLEDIHIPSTVTLIGSGAFWLCTSLKNVTILEGLQRICHLAFADCSSLECVTLPSSLNAIESYAFIDCVSLADVSLMGGILAMGEGVFRGCQSLESIEIPSKAFVIDTRFSFSTEESFYPMMYDQAIVAHGYLESMSSTKLTDAVYSQWTSSISLAQIRNLFAYYELINATTILELALWKSKIDECAPPEQESPSGPQHHWSCPPRSAAGCPPRHRDSPPFTPSAPAMSDAPNVSSELSSRSKDEYKNDDFPEEILTEWKNMNKQNVVRSATRTGLGPREEYRVRCGADVIIPNVLPFLWNCGREWRTVADYLPRREM